MLTDVVDQFLDVAAAAPTRVAIVHAGKELSYAGLEARVRALAHCFSAFDGPRILLAMPRIPDAYAAIFAAGLAGGYHTPLNLDAPIGKLERIAAVLRPDIIVAQTELGAALSKVAPDALVIDPADVDEQRQFAGRGRRHRRAYVIFTSGSTGVPKGVVVSRRALAAYVRWLTATFAVTPADRFSQHPNLAFDISMTDIFGALCHGARLCLLSGEADRLMPARLIERERVTIWNSVPSVVSLMDQAGHVTASNLSSVRIFNFCGEPLLPKQVEILFEACPNALVRNTYGPTEATIAVTDLPMYRHSYRPPARDSVSIGPPIGDIGLHLIGGSHPDEGELAITGEQLADGYWEDPEKTDRAFRTIDLAGRPTRAYFTGDWVERIDGELYFRERIDFQVKVKGYRVELDEVASAIRNCGWPVVCVFKRGDSLAAVVEHREGQTFDSDTLISRLRLMLEDHAVPVAIRKIDHLPRNENDKLDRKAAAAWFDLQAPDA